MSAATTPAAVAPAWKAAYWEWLARPETPEARQRRKERRLADLAHFLPDESPSSEDAAAAREWMLSVLPASPKRGDAPGDKPAWRLVHHRAMAPSHLPRVIAGMGFDRVSSELPRGGLPGFDPAYFRAGVAGMGREDAARRNRILSEAPCRLLCRGTPSTLSVYLDLIEGCWRDTRGGALGEDIISLGAYAWRCGFGRAAYRISRLTGHGELPLVGDLAGR